MNEELLHYLKALSDETRLRLACILQYHELSVNELVTLLSMGQSRISRHLKILTDAGLLEARRDGLWVFYKATEQEHERKFLDNILAFANSDNQNDIKMAEHIIEERTVKTRHFFNNIAEHWDELNKAVLGSFSLTDCVQEHVQKPCNVAVDLGCGTGEVLEKLYTVASNVVGVDGSLRMLELAKRRFSKIEQDNNVSLRIGDLNHLPLRDGEADFACINLVLHHLSNPQDAIMEISRILTKYGYLFISDFDQHIIENMRQTYGDRWLGFSKENLINLTSHAGLELVSYTKQTVLLDLNLHLLLVQKKH